MLLAVLLVCALLSEGAPLKHIDYKNFPRFSCVGKGDHEGKCKALNPLPIEKKRGCSPITGCRSG